MDLKEVEVEGSEWVNLAQVRDNFVFLANMTATFQFPLNDGRALPRTMTAGNDSIQMDGRAADEVRRSVVRMLQFLHCRKHFSEFRKKKFGQKFSVFRSERSKITDKILLKC